MDCFPEVKKIPFEGPQSRNPLAFRHYNADEVVEGKTLRDHLRFSVCYWHTFRATGADPFGAPTLMRPWDDGSETIENAKRRVDAAFEFMAKLGAPFLLLPHRDVAPDGSTLMAANRNLEAIVPHLKAAQQAPESSCWGERPICSPIPLPCTGRPPAPTPDVFAYAAAQVKKAIEVTQELGGEITSFGEAAKGIPTFITPT